MGNSGWKAAAGEKEEAGVGRRDVDGEIHIGATSASFSGKVFSVGLVGRIKSDIPTFDQRSVRYLWVLSLEDVVGGTPAWRFCHRDLGGSTSSESS
jgi:hypothetical protein